MTIRPLSSKSGILLAKNNFEQSQAVTSVVFMELFVADEIAIDCVMAGVGVSQGNKSALRRATLVKKWGNVIYDEFVKPIEHVVDFQTDISGIRPRDLKKGSVHDRSDAAASFVSLARDNDRYGKLLIEEGGVGPLLKLVKEGKPDGQENAARAIGLLGRDSKSVGRIIHAGVCLGKMDSQIQKIMQSSLCRILFATILRVFEYISV